MRKPFLCALALIITVACGDPVVTNHDVEDPDLVLMEKVMGLLEVEDRHKATIEIAGLFGLDSSHVLPPYDISEEDEEVAADGPDPECEVYRDSTEEEQKRFARCLYYAISDDECHVGVHQARNEELEPGVHVHCVPPDAS